MSSAAIAEDDQIPVEIDDFYVHGSDAVTRKMPVFQIPEEARRPEQTSDAPTLVVVRKPR